MTTHHPFRIRAFVLLPDHIHCIWTLPENDNNYSMRWQLIKSYFSRRCQNEYKAIQTAWLYSSFHRYVKQGDYDAAWGAGRKIEFDAKVGYE